MKLKVYSNQRKDFRGFTLIEILLAISLFLVAALIAADIFMINLKTQRKNAAASQVASEARYTLESIAHIIRTGTIDYSYYGASVPAVTNELAMTDSVGRSVVYRKNGDFLEANFEGGGWSSALPQGLKLSRLDFYIYPLQNPFAVGSAITDQPRATIVMAISNTAVQASEQTVIRAQTTASSKVYGK